MSVRGVIAASVAGWLMLTSTASLAAPAARPQINSWAILTATSGGAPAAAMCGSTASTSATAAARRDDRNGCVFPVMDAPPPQPIPGGRMSPLELGLIAIAAAAGIYLAFNAGNHPNSPA